MATVRKYLCKITEGANKVSVVALLIAATAVGCLDSVQNEGMAIQTRTRFEEGSFKTLPPLKLGVRKANYRALLPLELRRSKKIAIEESKARYSEIRRLDNRYCKKLTNHKADDLAADISPDSRKVVFPSERDGNTEVYIADLDAKTLMNISNNLMSDEGPKFFGDDSRVIFQSNRDGNWEVYLADLNSRTLINVSNHSSDDTLPNVSADSNRVVFTSKRDGNSEIYLVDLEEKTLINISNSPSSDPWADISGDGNKVVFQSNRDGNWEVYLADLNSRTLINVSNAPRASDVYPRISGDGTKVVFQSNRDGNEEVYLADLKGRGPKGSIQIELINISNDSKFDGIPTISKDGVLIAFSSLRDGNTEVYLSDFERMTLTNISNHPASDNGVLAISIDNKNVAFVSERNKNRDVYLAYISLRAKRQEKPTLKQVLDFIKEGKFEEAVSTSSTLLEDDPKNVDILTLRGNAYYRSGKSNLAYQDWRRILQLVKPPKAKDAGLFYKEVGYGPAIAYYHKCAQEDPETKAWASYNKSTIWLLQNFIKEALEESSICISEGEKSRFRHLVFARAFYNRGVVKHNLRMLDDAISDYENGISIIRRLGGDYSPAVFNLELAKDQKQGKIGNPNILLKKDGSPYIPFEGLIMPGDTTITSYVPLFYRNLPGLEMRGGRLRWIYERK